MLHSTMDPSLAISSLPNVWWIPEDHTEPVFWVDGESPMLERMALDRGDFYHWASLALGRAQLELGVTAWDRTRFLARLRPFDCPTYRTLQDKPAPSPWIDWCGNGNTPHEAVHEALTFFWEYVRATEAEIVDRLLGGDPEGIGMLDADAWDVVSAENGTVMLQTSIDPLAGRSGQKAPWWAVSEHLYTDLESEGDKPDDSLNEAKRRLLAALEYGKEEISSEHTNHEPER